jgi:hypothetical protein
MLEADLTDAQLAGASLDSTNLSSADLTDVDASGARMPRALCARTNFSGAQFVGADFTEAVFVAANLVETDLSGACLLGTRLSADDLQHARTSASTQLAVAGAAQSRPGRPKSLDSIREAFKKTRRDAPEDADPTRPSRSARPPEPAGLARSERAASEDQMPPRRETKETFSTLRPSTGEHIAPPARAGILKRRKQRRED